MGLKWIMLFCLVASPVFADGLLIGTNSKEIANDLREGLATEPERVLTEMGFKALREGDIQLGERLFRNSLLKNKHYLPAQNGMNIVNWLTSSYSCARAEEL